jgi:hypothetical protein
MVSSRANFTFTFLPTGMLKTVLLGRPNGERSLARHESSFQDDVIIVNKYAVRIWNDYDCFRMMSGAEML